MFNLEFLQGLHCFRIDGCIFINKKSHTLCVTMVILLCLFKGLIIEFENLSYNVSEGDTDLVYNLVITKSLESEQTFNIFLRGTGNTADDEDYSISSEVYLFPPEEQSITVPVTITGDRRIELTEDFRVTLSRSGGPIFLVDPVTRQTTINIEDNDGSKFIIYFSVESAISRPVNGDFLSLLCTPYVKSCSLKVIHSNITTKLLCPHCT